MLHVIKVLSHKEGRRTKSQSEPNQNYLNKKDRLNSSSTNFMQATWINDRN